MELNQDVLRGKVMQVSGAVLNKRGRLRCNYRETVMGQLRHDAGVLQERRGVVTGRLKRVRRRLLSGLAYEFPGS